LSSRRYSMRDIARQRETGTAGTAIMNVRQTPETDRQLPGAPFAPRALLADFAAAARFLTLLPLPARLHLMPAWPRMMRMFAAVGALAGLLSGAVLMLANMAGLSATLAAALAALAALALTGALHEDGLADLADALGGRTREKRLEILRDPRIGAFGVLALLFAVALPVFALEHVLFSRGVLAAVLALVLAHAFSRWFMLLPARQLPPARKEGLGRAAGRPDMAIIRQGLALALLLGALPALLAFSLAQVLAALTAGLLATQALIALARRLLGGQTGDVLGAAEVAARLAMLLVLSAS